MKDDQSRFIMTWSGLWRSTKRREIQASFEIEKLPNVVLIVLRKDWIRAVTLQTKCKCYFLYHKLMILFDASLFLSHVFCQFCCILTDKFVSWKLSVSTELRVPFLVLIYNVQLSSNFCYTLCLQERCVSEKKIRGESHIYGTCVYSWTLLTSNHTHRFSASYQ